KRYFIHEGNGHIALRVFDNFCRFSYLNGRCLKKRCGYNSMIEVIYFFKRFPILCSNDFRRILERVCLITWVEAFGGIDDIAVHASDKARLSFQYRSEEHTS